ncbi:MAG: divalent metal cation transporter [Candidatus Nezhaarchaeota archaeon]|nr:divalent metal cation transporter [Candidatus Nezhaarchaeota archaeon]
MRRLERKTSDTLELFTSGVVAGISNIDACAILCLLSISSIYGFSLLWALMLGLLIYIVVLQLTSELALVTGKGFAENLKSNACAHKVSLIVLLSVAANLSLLSVQVSGMAISLASLFDLPLTIAIAASAAIIFTTSSLKPCNLVDKVLVVLCVIAFSAVVLKAPPDYRAVVAGLVSPGLSIEAEYWVAAIAMMGISVGPNIIFYEASDLVEKGIKEEALLKALTSIIVGVLVCLVICLAIMTYGAALPPIPEDLTTAIKASISTFGRAFTTIFLIGLLASSLLAAIVTHQSTVALLSEVYGWRGVGARRDSKAWVVWVAIITIASTIPVLVVSKLVKLALAAAVINSIAAIPLLNYLVKLCTDPSLMGGIEVKRGMKVTLQIAVGTSIAVNAGGILIIVASRPLLGYITLPADLLILAAGAALTALIIKRLSFIKKGGAR